LEQFDFKKLNCPIGCGAILTFEEIEKICFKTKIAREKYATIMLEIYLRSTKDIKPCPNKKCNYFGYLPEYGC
jgi:hypothetical protein